MPPQPVALAPQRIDPQTRPSHVHLNVANLENALIFYQQVIGLELNWRESESAGLGAAGGDLVRLTQLPAARRYRAATGLYHFALLFPNRRELARVVSRLFSLRWPNSPTDHILTKTTYLSDPEGNEIELYCESPEDGVFGVDAAGNFFAQRADGTPSDGREALDLSALFVHLQPGDRLDVPVPPETRMGHFHLYVASLAQTRHFYHDLLGFDDMGTAGAFPMGMVAAGAYHHHIGYNTWRGEGAPPPPPDALGARYIAFAFASLAAWQKFIARLEEVELPYQQTEAGVFLSDPAHNLLLFQRPVSASTPTKK